MQILRPLTAVIPEGNRNGGLKTASTGAVRGFPGGGERQRRTERDCSVSKPIIAVGEQDQHWRMSGQMGDNHPVSANQGANESLCQVI
jgi:hypothetical protein